MDFVGQDDHIVRRTDLCDRREFIGRPEPPYGVVGVAQDHEPSLGPRSDVSETVPVHSIAVRRELQWIAEDGPP